MPHWFTEDRENLEMSASFQSRGRDLLFVGNIKAHKGLHSLLPAFKLARKRGLDARLVIVGNAGNFRTGDDSILEQFQSLPGEAFSFTGRIGDSQLRDLYRQCLRSLLPADSPFPAPALVVAAPRKEATE